jgi:hypothetical protein
MFTDKKKDLALEITRFFQKEIEKINERKKRK